MHNIKFDQNLSFNPGVMFDHIIKDGSFTTYFKCYSKSPFNSFILAELFKCINHNSYINSKYNRSTPKICQISAVYVDEYGKRIITPVLPKFLYLYKNDDIFKFLINNLPYFANVMCRREYGITAEGMEFTSARGLPWNVNGISYFEVRFWKFNNSMEVIRNLHFIAHLMKNNRMHSDFIKKYTELVLSNRYQDVNIHNTIIKTMHTSRTNYVINKQILYDDRIYDYK